MAACLLEKSLTTPLIPIEDLFVTGILGAQCGFARNDVPGIDFIKLHFGREKCRTN
jgi:hypothetical protein